MANLHETSDFLEYTFTVTAKHKGMRLDRFLSMEMAEQGVSREILKKAVLAGFVSLDDMPCTVPKTALVAGSMVTLRLKEAAVALSPEKGELTVVYRDASLAVVEKPSALTVHPCASCPEGTLANRLMAHFPELAHVQGFRPGIVHRLDKDTSGLLLVALSEESLLELTAQFSRREVHKEYLALVHGVPAKREGEINEPLARHPKYKERVAVAAEGKEAISAWRLLYADPEQRYSVLAVTIFTGRTHQIRVHLAHMGHPVLGDRVYGKPRLPVARQHKVISALYPDTVFTAPARQQLHAWKLSFVHPFPRDISTACDLSGVFPDGVPGQVQKGQTQKEQALCLNAALDSSRFEIRQGPEGLLSFTSLPPGDMIAAIRDLSEFTLHAIITGMPGCGKSTLLQELKKKGVPVFSADAAINALYEQGADGWKLLSMRFGNRFMDEASGALDKKTLGDAMRAQPALRQEIEAMMHPLVYHALELFWAENACGMVPLAVAEIPLYFETGHKKASGNTIVIGVDTPSAERRHRLMDYRGWTEETIATMESWQWPEAKKMAACQVVVANTGTAEDLAAKAEPLVRQLLQLREGRLAATVNEVASSWIPV